jgi:hypothetical protein
MVLVQLHITQNDVNVDSPSQKLRAQLYFWHIPCVDAGATVEMVKLFDVSTDPEVGVMAKTAINGFPIKKPSNSMFMAS